MKKMLFILFSLSSLVLAGTPTIDGSFDGIGVWGPPVATADGNAGWNSANAKKLYITYDNNFYYFGAEVTAADWNDWGFTLNTKSGGGSTEPWGRSINFGYSNLPDYVIKGHFGDPNDNGSNSPYAELRTWNGSSWTSTTYTSNIGEDETAFIEVKVAKADIDNATSVDAQFYITGNNNNHGTFDACPDDENADSWDESGTHTVLDNYAANTLLPVELTTFNAIGKKNSVELAWQTASETNNHGFEIERSVNGSAWNKIAFVEGKGTSNTVNKYSYTDQSATIGKYAYRLKQIDRDGSFKYSNIVETTIGVTASTFALLNNYPNPFNPTTSISFVLGTTEKASVKVFDILGNEISTIANGTYNAGEVNTVTFNAANLPSGLYFYRLESASKVETRKMLLMK